MTYTEKVINALRDDSRESLSFKDVDNLTLEEMAQILYISAAYGSWLYAVWERARVLYKDNPAFFETWASFNDIEKDIADLCEKLGCNYH